MPPRGKVLLLDGDDRCRLQIASRLGPRYLVREGRTMAEGRRILARDAPHVVLMDLRLPDGSGLDLLREFADRARKGEPPRTRFVVVSAVVHPAPTSRAVHLGAFDCLPKRFLRPWGEGLVVFRVEGAMRSVLAETGEGKPEDLVFANSTIRMMELDLKSFGRREAAWQQCMEPQRFSERFRECAGQTFEEVRRVLRFLKATEILLTERVGTADAAQRVGLKSRQGLEALFRKFTASPPQRYLETYLEDPAS